MMSSGFNFDTRDDKSKILIRPQSYSGGILPYILAQENEKLRHGSDVKSAAWRDFISFIGDKVGEGWLNLMQATAFLFYRYHCSSMDLQRILFCYGGQYYAMRSSCSHVDVSMKRMKSKLFPFDIGLGVVEYNEPYFDTSSEGFTEDVWAATTGLCCLWGLAWFKHFRVYPGGELRPSKYASDTFNEWVDALYSGLCQWDRDIVDRYLIWWRANSHESLVDWETYVSAHPAEKQRLGSVAYDTPTKAQLVEKREKIVLSETKNMGDWTQEDFWNEMTYLYSKVKSAEDVKSMKQILEMKAKSMGILDDGDKGTTNNIILIQQKAMTALEALGIRKRVVHDQ